MDKSAKKEVSSYKVQVKYKTNRQVRQERGERKEETKRAHGCVPYKYGELMLGFGAFDTERERFAFEGVVFTEETVRRLLGFQLIAQRFAADVLRK